MNFNTDMKCKFKNYITIIIASIFVYKGQNLKLTLEHARYYGENKQIDKITYSGFLNHKVFNESAQNTFFVLCSSEVLCLLNL